MAWLHAGALAAWGAATGLRSSPTALLLAAAVVVALVVAARPHVSTAIRASATCVALSGCSALLISASSTQPVTLLHGFLVISLASLYRQRVPLLVATVGVAGVQLAATSPTPGWAVVGMAMIAAVALTHLIAWQMEEHGRHDHVTGLLGRAEFLGRLAAQIERDSTGGGDTCVLMIDLDDFKQVNDTHGHDAGDELLAAVAGRITAATRRHDAIARLGGDEFAVLIDGGEAAAAEVAERICTALTRPFGVGGADVLIGASVGVATAGGQPPAELLRRADAAMYEAKRAGQHGWSVWRDDLADAMARHEAQVAGLRDAVAAHGGLPLRFAPVHHVADRRVAGVLVDPVWLSPRGPIEGAELTALLDEAGVSPATGRSVAHAALAHLTRWRPAHPSLWVGVTASVRQLADDGWADDLARRAADLGGGALWVRVDEPTLRSTRPAVQRALLTLDAAGCIVTLRAFGQATMSLTSLRHTALGALELDRDLTRDVQSRRRAWATTTAIMTMASAMDLRVAALDVDAPSDVEELSWLGVTLVGGPACSPAARRPDDLVALLQPGSGPGSTRPHT